MKRYLSLITLSLFLFACQDDEGEVCISCTSAQTADFEVCRMSNGDASVNGEDTNTNYEVYIAGLEEAGANCGN